jgi:glutamate synthase domain-containing protein 3
MTGGRVVVLGDTGRNFGAGMSGGVAYVYDPTGAFRSRVNPDMVDVEALGDDDVALVRDLVERHFLYTSSVVAGDLLDSWSSELSHFRKVMPKDYRRVLEVMRDAEARGLSEDATLARVMEAAHG